MPKMIFVNLPVQDLAKSTAPPMKYTRFSTGPTIATSAISPGVFAPASGPTGACMRASCDCPPWTFGIGELMRMGIERGRQIKPRLKVGICGEHGGDADSVKFCHKLGMDYVSCSPFRVPIARLAAAQAAIQFATDLPKASSKSPAPAPLKKFAAH